MGWGSLLSGFVGHLNTLVQEFYSNIEIVDSVSFFVFIWGHYLDIDANVLHRVLSIHEVNYPEYP